MAALVVACVVGCVALVFPSSRGRTRLEPPTDHRSGSVADALTGVVSRPTPRAVVCSLGTAWLAWVLLGPVAGLLGLPAGLVLAWWIGRLEPASAVRDRERIQRDLPLAADLMAGCAAAGQPPTDALRTVVAAIGGPLAARLDVVIARLELGTDPAVEWARVASDPALAPLGRAMERAARSGAPLATSLIRAADDARRARRQQSLSRARQVGVRAAGPLAGCFLPAFMLIGVVPTVAGAFQGMFG